MRGVSDGDAEGGVTRGADEVPIGGALPSRCPFCHASVASAEAFVACAGCLAKHHPACWDEGGTCAACGGERRLIDEGSVPDVLRASAAARRRLQRREWPWTPEYRERIAAIGPRSRRIGGALLGLGALPFAAVLLGALGFLLQGMVDGPEAALVPALTLGIVGAFSAFGLYVSLKAAWVRLSVTPREHRRARGATSPVAESGRRDAAPPEPGKGEPSPKPPRRAPPDRA